MNKQTVTTRLSIKLFIASWVLFLGITAPVKAQDFEEGLNLYKNQQFEEAANIFQSLDSPEAILFTGKSYYSLGEYLRAKSYLRQVSSDAPPEIQHEAQFTRALAEFQLDQFGPALNRLYELKDISPRTSLINNSNTFYNEILDYLTIAQRRKAFQEADFAEVQKDLVQSAFGKVDFQTAKILVGELKKSGISTGTIAYQELDQMLADSLTYNYPPSIENRFSAPRGIVYDIGAALPRFKPGTPDFGVSQGLFHGYLMAAEDFNQRNAGKKAFIRYQNTGADMDSAGYAMNHLAWSNNVDAVLGPLFSESALRMAQLAEQYQVPMLAPLANSDSLNVDNPYVFQANPTLASHGRKMAQHAVQNLKMDTLAVFAEKNSLGETSAYSFRKEAERLGAHIKHFMIEDLQSTGYDITDYTQRFAPDTVAVKATNQRLTSGPNRNIVGVDSVLKNSLDGVYAPFTGQAASTLIDLLLTDLQVMNSKLPILGSAEWGVIEIPEERRGGRSIHFTESYYINSKSPRVNQFRERYKEQFGQEASRFAMIGYDSADLLLRILERVENPALLKDVIKDYPLYEGLISNIRFNGTHVNQEVKVFTISDQGVQPAVY
ncbi:ABC transporter substrate-binding protein [Aliifodinibius sp. S!AR15-10]|uniref:ABC transporter substrate-binding protein n=1 Tax=Aliifodinibius sp. S!AR15-10 TaxID=2950437 RepID=UPI00286439A7|nr:ABC transporter substrate-binding protein [Aliifodinibius sp. S!AR15-10]MDR8391027.1 ABC transporter substrate-binding protein [Aliifodinibius sp. S!AR15-10]